MSTRLNVSRVRDLLQEFKFHDLFIEELGWNQPETKRQVRVNIGSQNFTYVGLAILAGIEAFEVRCDDGIIPDKETQEKLSKEISKHRFEHVLVFVDKHRTRSVWYWVRRDGTKRQPRDHSFFKGQPGDLFIAKLANMVVDLSELDERGQIPLVEAANKVRRALDIERVIKRFFKEFDDQRLEFTKLIRGIPDEKDRRWYASVLLNRLMFIYFLQRKLFIDGGDGLYLENKLSQSKLRGPDRFFGEFLQALFFEAFAKPEGKRSQPAKELTGKVKYLNGGLFLKHRLEQKYQIEVPDVAFDELLGLFGRYSWNLNDIPGESDDDINPDVLGYIFEKYINQKEFGAYYTRPEITEYLCEQTIYQLILDRANEPDVEGLPPGRRYYSVPDLLIRLDSKTAKRLLHDILPDLTILDPAVGSGAFLVAALKTLITVYSAVIGWLQFHDNDWLMRHLKTKMQSDLSRVQYAIKKAIITDNLYGVDMMEEATEIAKLRLFMTLVASAQNVEELEPLPNIDFNILAGNSLIGLTRVEDVEFEAKQSLKDKTASLFAPTKTYRQILNERNLKVDQYRHASGYTEDLGFLRDDVDKIEDEARPVLAALLRQKFDDLGVGYETATWDDKNHKLGKPLKQSITAEQIADLRPLHWGFEFDAILNLKGGFDAIITNPPWEIVKPYAKEFFQRHSELVTKNKLTIRDFEAERDRLMRDREMRSAYLDYLSQFPHQSGYFRSAPEYSNQQSTANGRRVGSDVNLYKLFTERCHGLLRPGGLCGIVLPSGIYTDLGAKGLRQLLFSKSVVTGLFCFENRRVIFEGVDSRFKFVVLTFIKGGATNSFPAAFMRTDVADLLRFPAHLGTNLSVASIRALAPESLAIPEFKSDQEAGIASKMHTFPSLSSWLDDKPLSISREFMTSDDHPRFNTNGDGLIVYEGKMIEQFEHQFERPQWWISEGELRQTRFYERGDWQRYRLAIRRVAASTNARTLIATVLPKNTVVVHSLFVNVGDILSEADALYLVGLLNSYVLDYATRGQVTTNVTKFNIHQLPVPLPNPVQPIYSEIVGRVLALICGTDEFCELFRSVSQAVNIAAVLSNLNGLELVSSSDDPGDACIFEIEPTVRQRIRNELDARVAFLFGLNEEEFAYVLGCFSSSQSDREAILAEFTAFRAAQQIPSDPLARDTKQLISKGESDQIEFKQSLEAIVFDSTEWKARGLNDNQIRDKRVEIVKGVIHSSLKTVCAFLNTEGGTLLIGVHDLGDVIGIEPDLQMVKGHSTDGFELKLRSMIKERFEPVPLGLITVRFVPIDGKVVCRVDVSPDRTPHHLDGDVFVREGNNTLLLKGPDLTQWIARRMDLRRLKS